VLQWHLDEENEGIERNWEERQKDRKGKMTGRITRFPFFQSLRAI